MRRTWAAAAAGIAAATVLLPACGSSDPSWCTEKITMHRAGGTPVNMGPYGVQSIGYGRITVPSDFPALIRRDARTYNRGHDLLVAMALGAVWRADIKAQCR